MIRQIALLLSIVVLLAFGGSAAVGTWIFQKSMQSQWQARNGDAAALLAQVANAQRGDLKMIELVLQAQFDAGHYRRIRLAGVGGQVIIERESPEQVGNAPTWFIRALPLQAPPGVATVIDGWRQIGQLSVESHGAWAYNALWDGMLREILAASGKNKNLAGIRTVAPSGAEIAADPDAAIASLVAAIEDCAAKDGAECVILGGAGLAGLATPIRARTTVAIVDPLAASLDALHKTIAGTAMGAAPAIASDGLSAALAARLDGKFGN